MQTTQQRPLAARPLSNQELSAFCGQMALILQSGISSLDGLDLLLEDAETEEERAVLRQIIGYTQEGSDLPGALEATGLYPEYMLRMVRIGEETGTLDEVLRSLSEYYEREDAIARSIRNAVTYPMVMVVMMVAVIVVLLVRVMPIFNQVFVQLGSEMTGFSRVLMNLGTAISRYSILLTVLLAAVIGLMLFGARTEQGRALCQRLGRRIPLTRHIFEDRALCRFAGGMALTLRSGLSPDRCLELVLDLSGDPDFRTRLEGCNAELEAGESLAVILRRHGILTGVYAQMASIGSRTGTMDQVMARVAGLVQEELDTRMSNALAVLEPTLVIGLSLVVGAILLSVMLPLLGIMSSM